MNWTEVFTTIGTLIAFLSYFRWAMMAEFKAIRAEIKAVKVEINSINEKLGNHITDTNKEITETHKKIDELRTELKGELKETKIELKTGQNRLDKKFDDLYKFLLSNKDSVLKKSNETLRP